MDIQAGQPISDDQELAKVLAGITAGADQTSSQVSLASDLEGETTGMDSAPADDALSAPAIPPLSNPPRTKDSAAVSDAGDLESIKSDALNELRPLVDKLNVSPEEKFDTYLLLIRSTDDASLIAAAHESARSISDEGRRAQALLDIIKEIDYLSGPRQQAA